MATKKKTTTKKAAPRKAVRKSKTTRDESFLLVPEKYPFFTFRVTDQTVYWSILFILILLIGVWVINIQIQISDILDSIQY